MEKRLLEAKYFQKIKIDGVKKYDIADKDSKYARRLAFGVHFTTEDVVPQKLTKKDIASEIANIPVKKELLELESEMITILANW